MIAIGLASILALTFGSVDDDRNVYKVPSSNLPEWRELMRSIDDVWQEGELLFVMDTLCTPQNCDIPSEGHCLCDYAKDIEICMTGRLYQPCPIGPGCGAEICYSDCDKSMIVTVNGGTTKRCMYEEVYQSYVCLAIDAKAMEGDCVEWAEGSCNCNTFFPGPTIGCFRTRTAPLMCGTP